MSSILDALKKSERQRSLGRDLIFRHDSHAAPSRLTWVAVAVLAILLLLALAVGVSFSLRQAETVEVVTKPTVSGENVNDAVPADANNAAPPAVRVEALRELVDETRSVPHTPTVLKPSTAPLAPALPPGGAPWLSSLPEAFRNSLPPLDVNIHVYSPDESRRILYINNRQVQQGERIQAGVLIEEIAQDGVILRFRGQRFKLPRPS